MLRLGMAIVGTVVALEAVGCGQSTLSQTEFANRANAVCVNANRRIEHSAHGLEHYVAAIVESQKQKVTGIGALHPPAELKVTYQRYEAILRQRSLMFQRALAAIRKQKRPGGEAVQSAELQMQEHALASSLKLTKC